MLVKKSFGSRRRRHKKRNWHLQSIKKEEPTEEDDDYFDFLEDLEEDHTYRQGVNIYKSKPRPYHMTVTWLVAVPPIEEGLVPAIVDSEDEEEGVAPDAPQISVEEMLQNMTID